MSLSLECRDFLRRLGDHVATAGSGNEPAHAVVCTSCAAQLRLACRLGAMIGERPKRPEQLTQPQFFASIHERIVAEAEQGALVRALTPHLERVPVPDSIPWPDQRVGKQIIQHGLIGPTSSPPPWLWSQVRDQVLTDLARRRRPVAFRRLAWVAAAAAVLLVGLLLRQGTRAEPEIVFVTVGDMPSLQHPTMVLRQGLGR